MSENVEKPSEDIAHGRKPIGAVEKPSEALDKGGDWQETPAKPIVPPSSAYKEIPNDGLGDKL
jgi:hypothetical protein